MRRAKIFRRKGFWCGSLGNNVGLRECEMFAVFHVVQMFLRKSIYVDLHNYLNGNVSSYCLKFWRKEINKNKMKNIFLYVR